MSTIIITDGPSGISGLKVRKMHWIYFILFGWMFGFMAVSLIVPLFFKAGRRFVGACFGYW